MVQLFGQIFVHLELDCFKSILTPSALTPMIAIKLGFKKDLGEQEKNSFMILEKTSFEEPLKDLEL